jgi:hypothetical protein
MIGGRGRSRETYAPMIGGRGLAEGCWRLACERTGYPYMANTPMPMRMADDSPCCVMCAAYYRLCESASKGFEVRFGHEVWCL